MIRAAIIGAGTPAAGELIRILVNHPDVEIVASVQPEYAGRLLEDVHPGLIGDTFVRFVQDFDPTAADQIFICENTRSAELIRKTPGDESPRIVDLTGRWIEDYETDGFVTGIPELFRKPLVRGARRGLVTSPEITAAMILLGPLASHMLLSGEIKMEILLPEDLLKKFESERFSDAIHRLLQKFQLSWNGSILTKARNSKNLRGMKVGIELRRIVDLPAVREIYDSVYDDHNFTFMKSTSPEYCDVVGTQKAIFNIARSDEDKMRLEICVDARMRGGAGDAVHVMNLLFALHEKTGLALKTSTF